MDVGNGRAKETVFFRVDDYFSCLIEDVLSAHRRVIMESYIFAVDGYGKRLIDAMTRVAERGVAVYLLVDGVGSLEYIAQLTRMIRDTKVNFKIFHPLPWQLQQVPWYSFIPMLFIKLIQGIAELNCRDHRKCCIIDERILYTGSFNVVSCVGVNVGVYDWCDIGVRVISKGLEPVVEAFMAAWNRHKVRKTWREIAVYLKGNPWVRLNHSWYQRFGLRRAMLKRLRSAKQRVWITNAYFVPDSRFMKTLLEVADRGVEVKILLPSESDVSFMPLAARTFYQKMLVYHIEIFEYMPAILHAKTLIIDDWMMIGSSNLNHRSLLHDLELDVVLRTQLEKKRLVDDFNKKLTEARRVMLSDLVKMPWWKKMVGNLLIWMRYWL